MDAIRVLLVEDNTSTRLLLRSYLDGLEGIEICAEAADGARGLELIWALEPDLVLLDLVMTGLDGLGLLRALRTQPPLRRPKIIVLSHLADDDTIRRTARLGVNFYMTKPVNFLQLSENIRFFCTREEQPPGPGAGRAYWLLLDMGAPPESLGCRYAALTAGELSRDESGGMLLKQAYAPAMREGRTDRCNVEKNIRDLITRLHAQGSPAYCALMGGKPACRPDNKTFLTRLAQAVRR